MRYIFTSLLFFFATLGFSQEKQLVQFSGVTVDGTSLEQIPFTSIMIKNSNRGTIADYSGYFSFVAAKTDTIVFSYIGYGSSEFVIPDTLTSNRYSLIQIMTQDTITLSEAVIYPWPSKEEFRQAFLNLSIPSDDYDRAMRNLALSEMKHRMYGTAVGASGNYSYVQRQQQARLYYAGQAPPNNLLNPVAWAKFIDSWKKGEFKKK